MSQIGITAVKSYNRGKIALRISAKPSGWHGPSATIALRGDLETAHARAIAAAIIAAADAADEREAKEKAVEARRQKWRERERAAGRLVYL